jgi:predicted small lipoprotein YifL
VRSARLLLALLALIAACGEKAPSKPAETWPPAPTDGTPVAWEFVSIQGQGKESSATMKVYNFADKDVRSVQLKLEYLDASGTVIDDFPWGISKGMGLVKAKATAVEDEMGFDLPPATKTVRAIVGKVEYADGTAWTRP